MPDNQMSLDEVFPEVFGGESVSELPLVVEEQTKETTNAPYSKAYWEYALGVINLWARYQAAKKLYINATHEETRRRVQSVVNDKKYYGGSTRKIYDRKESLSYQLSRKLAGFADVCEFYGVEPVTREWLYDHLKEAKDYASYRGRCQRRFKKPEKYPAISLQEL